MSIDSLEKRIQDPLNWRTYYGSPRMQQIEDVLLTNGVREPRLSRLVRKVDRIAAGEGKPLWIDGDRAWLLFTERGFLRINRRRAQRRPTLRQVEQLYG